MKKKLVAALAVMVIATILYLKVNQGKQSVINDTVLANVEALASNEIIMNEYICYGSGSVVCPITGELVAGYYKRRSLE